MSPELLVAAVLVALVVSVFLQNVECVVPTLSIPFSILFTFSGLYLLGYSINLVTLFALVLAIGIVVDDAIIVIENVHRLMKEEKLSPVDAASKSMRQISGAIIATTLVLLAMFVPICFLRGITGEIYRQFGVTISIAVLLSAVNALTLSPALAALFLRPADAGESRFFLCRWFNAGFNRVMGGPVAAGDCFGTRAAVLIAVCWRWRRWICSGNCAGFIPARSGVIFAQYSCRPVLRSTGPGTPRSASAGC